MLIAPAWQAQPWFPKLLEMSVGHPVLLPQIPNLLTNPKLEVHPLIQNKPLRLVTWTVSGKNCLQKAYQTRLPVLSRDLDEKEQTLITNRPGESGLIGVVGKRLIPLDAI